MLTDDHGADFLHDDPELDSSLACPPAGITRPPLASV
jgi:hypothetical protein